MRWRRLSGEAGTNSESNELQVREGGRSLWNVDHDDMRYVVEDGVGNRLYCSAMSKSSYTCATFRFFASQPLHKIDTKG